MASTPLSLSTSALGPRMTPLFSAASSIRASSSSTSVAFARSRLTSFALYSSTVAPTVAVSFAPPRFYSLQYGLQRNSSSSSSSSFIQNDLCAAHQQQSLKRGKRLRSLVSPQANWKQEILWTEVPVTRVESAAVELFSVSVDISGNKELQEGYSKAGQFVQVKVGNSKPAFLAIASPPKAAKAGVLEFLIKDVEGSTASLICALKEGDSVEMSQVMGKGFNLSLLDPPEDFPSLLIFATGSGISPIRALLEEGISAEKRKDVRLYFGAQDLSRLAYQEKFAAWEEAGVTIIPVLSQADETWTGDRGFVQAAYSRSSPVDHPHRAGAVLCGQKAMAEEVTSILVEQGVPKEQILLNF